MAGPSDGVSTPEELIELADRALYRAKEAGRNQVEVEVAGERRGERTIRLLVADDDEGTRLTLGSLLEREDGLELVGVAADASGAVELATLRRPDVVVRTSTCRAGAGSAPRSTSARRCPGVRIVALSADDSAAAQLDMSRAGAIGYVVKGAADDEIVRAIRSAFRW